MATIMDSRGAQSRPLLLCTGKCANSTGAELAVAQFIPVTAPEPTLWTGPPPPRWLRVYMPLHFRLASDGLISGYLLASTQDELWCSLHPGALCGIRMKLVTS